ncbi:MAG: sugar transferase [Pseudomonadota bacterium]|jgi:lipopolysaccharide/colanic/teichoic acid biosynthesis glycosyltransferase
MPPRDQHGPATPPSTTTLAFKRALDLAGATIGLVLLAPLFVIIAIAIRLETPGPALFRQIRVGRGGRPFRIYKFRSMQARQAPGGTALTVHADRRITRVGAALRRTKLDELPQLINVLAGDMSLVGPRPEVPEFMAFYTPEQRAVLLTMRPGMTDYAAILFRDESAMLLGEQDPIAVYRYRIMPIKFGYYERYSHEIGAINDLRIIIATVLLLLTGHLPHALGIEAELQTFTRERIAG